MSVRGSPDERINSCSEYDTWLTSTKHMKPAMETSEGIKMHGRQLTAYLPLSFWQYRYALVSP